MFIQRLTTKILIGISLLQIIIALKNFIFLFFDLLQNGAVLHLQIMHNLGILEFGGDLALNLLLINKNNALLDALGLVQTTRLENMVVDLRNLVLPLPLISRHQRVVDVNALPLLRTVQHALLSVFLHPLLMMHIQTFQVVIHLALRKQEVVDVQS